MPKAYRAPEIELPIVTMLTPESRFYEGESRRPQARPVLGPQRGRAARVWPSVVQRSLGLRHKLVNPSLKVVDRHFRPALPG